MTTEAQLLEPDDAAWMDVLRSTSHDIYHLPEYVTLSSPHERGSAVAAYVRDGDRSLLLPLILRVIPGGGGLDATSPYGYPGPVGTGREDQLFLDDALESIRATLHSVGCVSLFVRLHPLLNVVVPGRFGRVVDHGPTVGMDLTLAPDESWRQTRENHQRGIKRALRDGFVAGPSDRDADLEAFVRVYEQTMSRLDAADYYFFDPEYYLRLRSGLGDHLTLIVVKREGEVAAGGLFFEADGLVQYHLSGSDERFLSWQPTKLMLHEARTWGHDRGDRWLHLGGGVGAADDSLFQFKAGFSPLRHRFKTWRAIIDETRYLELLGAAIAPTDLEGYFPAYRR